MPDGQTIVFHSSRAGSQTIWRISAKGGQPEPVTTGAGQARNPAVSPDGRHLVYQNVRFGSALTLVDPATRRVSSVLESRENLLQPRFSPDGHRLAYFARMDGTFRVFTIAAEVPQLGVSAPMASGVFPRWSSDGRFLYLLVEDRASLLKIVTSGGEPSEAFAWPRRGAVRQRRVHWVEMAPAERTFAYTWMEGEAVAGTSVVDRATGQETGLSLPLAQFRWGHDGHSIVGTRLARSGRPATGHVVL